MSNQQPKPSSTSGGRGQVPKTSRDLGEPASGFQPVASNASATPPTPAVPVASTGNAAATAPAHTASAPSRPPAGDARVPGTWDAIKPGVLVLATTGPMEGWFESLVVATRADECFLLRWRDWPQEPEFTRRRDELALLHPATDPQG